MVLVEVDDLSLGSLQPGQEQIAFYKGNDFSCNCGGGDSDDAASDKSQQQFARVAGDMAYLRVMEFENTSNLVKAQRSLEDFSPDDYLSGGDISRLDWSDIVVRSLLGVGGFACVCKVRVPKFEETNEEEEDGEEEEEEEDENNPLSSGGRAGGGRGNNNKTKCIDAEDFEEVKTQDSSRDYTRTNTTSVTSDSGRNTPYYALKCLNQRTVSCESTFVEGAADLASEALLLSHLRHDNIVRLHAVSKGCVSDAFLKPGGYFLLLEFLRGTVGDLLRLWREDLTDDVKAAKIPGVHERLSGIALGIAKGMEYLHVKKVMLRDLKPANVGFDREGNVRLFDFGLAREVTTTSDSIIQGVAGSYRYVWSGGGGGWMNDDWYPKRRGTHYLPVVCIFVLGSHT
jgi:serine/threonine protein kinase